MKSIDDEVTVPRLPKGGVRGGDVGTASALGRGQGEVTVVTAVTVVTVVTAVTVVTVVTVVISGGLPPPSGQGWEVWRSMPCWVIRTACWVIRTAVSEWEFVRSGVHVEYLFSFFSS